MFQSKIIDIVFQAAKGPTELIKALNNVCDQCEQAANDGYQLLVLSDRAAGSEYAPVRYFIFIILFCWFLFL